MPSWCLFGNFSSRSATGGCLKRAVAIQVYYVVNKPTSFFWRGGKGFVTGDMIKEHLPPPSDDNLVLVSYPSEDIANTVIHFY